MQDWIAINEEDYINKAIYFSADIESLAHIKINLRSRVLSSPLFDGKRFAINFGISLKEMWNIYLLNNISKQIL